MTDAPASPLKLFNSLTRSLEIFQPVHPGEARVYSCGPTVYNYPHIGNMRAYVFADTLGRTLSYKGYALTPRHQHHRRRASDRRRRCGRRQAGKGGRMSRPVDLGYRETLYRGLLGRREGTQYSPIPRKWSIATDYVPAMIEFAKAIADKHCYELDSGLYFDTTSVADYGRLARARHRRGRKPHRPRGRQAPRRRLCDLAQDAPR
jgi:cysteinyl-tRNA synthetase